jgi:hypothetical protein
MTRPSHKTLFLALTVLALFFVSGCQDEDNNYYVDRTPPVEPRGLFSVTGDGKVDLYWIGNTEEDLAGYRVYWNDTPTGAYEYMATTANAHYTDYDVVNGTTYYYAVTAYDRDGNESELSFETISDTPRPEGFDLVLYDYNGSSYMLSGYDFSTYQRQQYNLPSTDIFYGYVDGMHVMYAWNPDPDWPSTDIQDAGYRDLDEADDAPPDGWTEDHLVILTQGHSYFVWTRTNNYAKFYVKEIGAGYVVLDWAYQTAPENPELAPRKLAGGGGTVPEPSKLSANGGVVR